MSEESLSPFKESGEVKTDLYCHNCSRNFVALLDYRIDGNHKIECPHCRHIHYRVIKDGVVSGDRFDSDFGGSFDVEKRRIWKSKDCVLPCETSAAGMFIRQSWLRRES